MVKKLIKFLLHIIVMICVYTGAVLFLTPYAWSFLQTHLAGKASFGNATSVSSVTITQPYAKCFQTSNKNSPVLINANIPLETINCIKREAEEYLRMISGV